MAVDAEVLAAQVIAPWICRRNRDPANYSGEQVVIMVQKLDLAGKALRKIVERPGLVVLEFVENGIKRMELLPKGRIGTAFQKIPGHPENTGKNFQACA